MAVYYARLLYNANGGSGAPSGLVQSSTTPHVLKTFTISSTKPSRTYFNFLGWGSSSGSTSASYAPGGTLQLYTATEAGEYNSKTLYAVWQHQTAYVYYNANGGTGAPSTQSHWAGYSVTLSATIPTRTGYNFLGWATSASATSAQYQPNTDYQIYTTVTLYAVWQPASSKLSTTNGTLGTAQTINITRYVNTYTDTITYSFGSATGTIATKTNAGSVSWTPPTSLATQIPNSSTGTCTLTCTTYNGNTVVGTSSITITLSVPQSLAPTVSVSYADTIAQCLTWGLLVQSRSKLAFTITASGQQGATIASYSTSVNGTSYNSASFTTDVLLYNGSNSYTVTVTDSRGLQTVSTGTFSVVAYSNPSLTLTLCDRNDSDPDQVDIGFDFSVASVSSNNDANYRLDYKKKGTPTWTNGTVQSLGSYSGSISDLIANLDGGDEWDIRINVIDSFQTASVESEVGVAGNILLNSRHNGGLGLLMKSQADNQLDIGKPTVHHGAVLEQFGSTVASHSASGNYATVCNFGHRAIPSPQSYTGNPVNFMASAGDTITALSADITAVQSGSGTPSPSNPRAISGLTGLTVYVNSTNSSSGATTYNIDWTSDAGTVYGGTLDVISGVLTVDRAMVDLGTKNWVYDSTATYPYFRTDGIASVCKHVANHGVVANLLCSMYYASSENDAYLGTTTDCVSMTTWGQIRIRDTRYSDAAAFKTALSGVQLCYELATPITYQLTPQTVSALIGQNYIWSSANENVSLTVQPNTNLAVDNALTLEWLRSSDSTPTKTTIRFNSAFGLDSFITDNGLCYMSYANDIWSFFVEKTSVDDIINIIDFHNPWSNSDMTIEWEDSSVSTLPTGYVQAVNIPSVVDSGTSNSWEYRLYSDKKIIATRTITTELTHYTTVNGFYGYYITNIAVPMTMANTDYYVGCTWSIGSGFSISAGLLSITANQFNAYALSTASGTNSVTLHLYLEGYKQ